LETASPKGRNPMRAYYVYDTRKALDHVIIPDLDLMAPVNRKILESFIGVQPDFSKWPGKSANRLPVESFGRIIAVRDDDGDVCVSDASLWQERMAFFLDRP
jgi:hypothetical protein